MDLFKKSILDMFKSFFWNVVVIVKLNNWTINTTPQTPTELYLFFGCAGILSKKINDMAVSSLLKKQGKIRVYIKKYTCQKE